MKWESDRRVMPGGDVGGDHQAGDSYSLRYHLASDRTRIVTVYTYPVQDGRRFKVETQTEFMVCENPQRPGDTEVWADATYTTDRAVHATVVEAGRCAEKLIRQHRPNHIRWDGKATLSRKGPS